MSVCFTAHRQPKFMVHKRQATSDRRKDIHLSGSNRRHALGVLPKEVLFQIRILLSETRKLFRLMLSSMSAAASAVTKLFFFNISEIIRASEFKVYHKVALDSLYISAGKDAINYFRSEVNRTNV